MSAPQFLHGMGFTVHATQELFLTFPLQCLFSKALPLERQKQPTRQEETPNLAGGLTTALAQWECGSGVLPSPTAPKVLIGPIESRGSRKDKTLCRWDNPDIPLMAK